VQSVPRGSAKRDCFVLIIAILEEASSLASRSLEISLAVSSLSAFALPCSDVRNEISFPPTVSSTVRSHNAFFHTDVRDWKTVQGWETLAETFDVKEMATVRASAVSSLLQCPSLPSHAR